MDKIIFDTLSEVMLPNIKFEFAETEPMEQTKTEDESKIISTQLQRLEIRLERVKLAYEDGIDTLEEYKANKKSILEEIDNLKKMLETSQEETPIKESPISKKEIRRLTALLQDDSISNTDKNKVARTIFKEIVKGGEDGKTLKCVFWR